jgi:hypothetical protein
LRCRKFFQLLKKKDFSVLRGRVLVEDERWLLLKRLPMH